MASRLTFEEAHRFLTEHREAVLLDVREEPEYITGHARDALLLPVDELTEESAGLVIGTKDTPVLVYCRTGRRSREAVRKLEEMGYTEVYDMGGLVGWPYGLEEAVDLHFFNANSGQRIIIAIRNNTQEGGDKDEQTRTCGGR